MAYVIGLVLLAGAYFLGGWYWTLVYAAVAVGRSTVVIPFVWIVVFHFTGDRRLFFPFSLHVATLFGQGWRGGFAAGAGLVIAVFALIRIEQEASFRVLAVELVVAVVAAGVGWAATRRLGPVVGAVVASVVALAGLVF